MWITVSVVNNFGGVKEAWFFSVIPIKEESYLKKFNLYYLKKISPTVEMTAALGYFYNYFRKKINKKDDASPAI